jgi:hypothetical protein
MGVEVLASRVLAYVEQRRSEVGQSMRYSELSGKEIVCIDEGIRLGVVDHTDLVMTTTHFVPYAEGDGTQIRYVFSDNSYAIR